MRVPLRNRRTAVVVLAVIVAPPLTLAAVAFLLFSRYVEIEQVGPDAAAQAFAAARARLADRAPLIQYRGFDAPVIRRDPEAPIHELRALRVLAYNADEGELTRGTFPIGVLRAVTFGGRIRLMRSGLLGGPDERITLGDLERHGPGLVLDSTMGTPGVLSVADAVLGSKSAQSRLLVWTE